MPIPDRQKQRREYLRKKAGAYGDRLNASCLFFVVLTLVAFSGIIALVSLILSIADKDLATLVIFLFMGSLTTIGIFGCRALFHFMQMADEKIKSITYVPPVTPHILPAEEVLVRASQESESAQNTVLLRAAESSDTPAEELLRASAGEQREA